MKHSCKFRLRVVADDNKLTPIYQDGLTYSEACEHFVFYVRCALELNVHIRVVNIFLGKKCIKMFVNHA